MMSKHQGKEVRQTMKGFLSGARKMARPRENVTFFAGVILAGADRVNCWATSK
jgi:hypothetical protein